MIGRVGHDDHGAALINDLASEGIDTTGIGIAEETLTGLAVITVDDDTENTIVVSPGANMSLSPDHIAAHQVLLAEAKVMLAQLEVPLETVAAAAEAAGGLVCLNPAPARPLPDELLNRVDVLVPNRSELAFLTGIPLSQTIGEVERAVSRLHFSGAVVVTLGADGALVIDKDTVTHVEAPQVEAVDPTGAGDAFCGALAHSLSQGQTLLEAANWAVVAGAVAATRHGRRHRGSPAGVSNLAAITRPIIIDADPGQDDAVAILLALASPEDLEVLAITAVAGNVPLDLTVNNALSMVELANRSDVPVYRGSVRPMVKTLVTAEYVHGPTGLDGADLPPPTIRTQPEHAVDKIVETLMASDDQITVCTLGPLTNIGLALVREPGIVDKIDRLVMMGGGFFEGGNTTPAAEFNIYVDPHAAHVVFTSGIPIVMMPLDVTHQALTTPDRLESAIPPAKRWPGCSTSTTDGTWRNTGSLAGRFTTRR